MHAEKPYLFLRGRKSSGERVDICAFGFRPRFFAKDEDIKIHRKYLDISPKVRKIVKNPVVRGVAIETSIYGDPVSLIICNVPKDVRDSHAKKNRTGLCNTVFKDCETFLSDIPFEITFLIWAGIKSGVRIPDKPDMYIKGFPAYHWKKLIPFDDFTTEAIVAPLDIETYYFKGDNPSAEDAELPITAINMKRFNEKKSYSYFYNPEKVTPGKRMKKVLTGALKDEYDWFIKFFRTESDMFLSFLKDFNKLDPDIWTAWNANFDYGYILNRFNLLDLNKKAFSPYHKFMKSVCYMRGKIPYVAGVTILDETNMYYKHTFFKGEKHSYKLQNVAVNEVGVGKVPKIVNGKRMTTGQLVQHVLLLLRYNAIDTELVELIARVKNIWGYKEYVRRKMGVPIERVNAISISLHTLFVHEAMKLGMAFVTRDFSYKEKFKGGMVFPAKPGVSKSAVAYDFKSLYAVIISMWNMSLETLIRDPTKHTKEYLDTCIKTPNNLYFKQKSEQLGFITRKIEEFIRDRDGFKEEYLVAYDKWGPDDPRTEAIDMAQMYEKGNTNAVFGVYKVYERLIAEAIAAIGREAIKYAAKLSESDELKNDLIDKFGLELLIIAFYGDTDSTFNSGIDPFNEMLMEYIGQWISKHMIGLCERYNVPENKFKFRAEKAYDSFFMADRQKAYCGHIVKIYKETKTGAEWRNVDEFKMVGFEKSDISQFGNESFNKLMEQVCLSARHDFDLKKWIKAFVLKLKKKLFNKRIPAFKICPTTKIVRSFDSYGKKDKKTGQVKGIPIHVKAAIWSNENLHSNYMVKDKIPWIYVEGRVKGAIALPEGWGYKDLEKERIQVDLVKMFKKQIIEKFRDPLLALGMDIDEVIDKVKQTSLGALV